MNKRLTFIIPIALVFISCGSDNPIVPTEVLTGISGEVHRSPTEPVCVVGEPCSETFAATFHLFSNNVEVLSFETGSDGKFRLELAPGEYIVAPDASAPIMYPEVQSKEFTVFEGEVTAVLWLFDTGIR